MDLDHGVMAPMWHSTSPAQPGDAARPATPPSGCAARTMARHTQKHTHAGGIREM
jgi:uncharacterized protein involved in copper resistance